MPDIGGWSPEVIAKLLDALQASGHGKVTFEARKPGERLRIVTEFTAVSEEELAQAIDNLRA